MNTIKWVCFGVMLAGALVTSLQLDPILGIELVLRPKPLAAMMKSGLESWQNS
jgi:hypothetical protein